MREVCQKGRSYLPLEAFRAGEGKADSLGERAHRTFRSSGTTSSERSWSRFSEAGLAAYRSGSLTAFFAVLKKETDGVREITRGVSLIPPVCEWPESSLAQMVAWIGGEMPVAYATGETLAARIAEAGDEPLFVFGTAFHFVHLLDAQFRKTLPPGSLVIETGGTKGKSRQVTRAELYAGIAGMFDVGQDRIVSEYGMCELASQAYGKDRLKFPNWVRVSVLTGPGKVEAKGRGALVVDDPQRLDVSVAIRTEDLVDLAEDGSFQLLGRLESAPLKGCSLLAEDVLESEATPAFAANGEVTPHEGDAARAQAFLDFFDDFLAKPLVHKALSREFGSDAAATAALEDLAFSAPGTVEDWLAATKPRRTASHWLLILPENHSLVGLYPLAMAYVLGLKVTVRVPRRFEPKTSFLQIFLDHLQELPDASLGTVDASFRAGKTPFDAHGVMVFGSDETVAALKALLPGKLVQGFGNHVGWTEFSADRLDELARDALSLGQRGCMATRVAVTRDRTLTESDLAARIAEAGAKFWDAPLDWRLRVALDGAALELEAHGFTVHEAKTPAAPLVATRLVESPDDVTPELLRAAVSRHPFVIPVVIVKSSTGEFRVTKSRYQGLSFREVGEANRPIWDGSHETRELFAAT